MPRVTGDERRMTNVKLSDGNVVQGIRRNKESASSGGTGREARLKGDSLMEGDLDTPHR